MTRVLALISSVLLAQAAIAADAPLKDYGRREYVRVSKDLPHVESAPWRLVCTMPHNCHFQTWIEVEAEAGQVIQFNSSNPLVVYLTGTESYTTRAGVQDYEGKHWVSGEGAIHTIPAGVTVKAVKYRETGFDTTFAGSFEGNDRDYTVLWKKAARTAYICMRDHFYDCPDRERVGFWGDGTPELNQCFYVFDTNAHRLAKDLVLRKLEPKFCPGQHLGALGFAGHLRRRRLEGRCLVERPNCHRSRTTRQHDDFLPQTNRALHPNHPDRSQRQVPLVPLRVRCFPGELAANSLY